MPCTSQASVCLEEAASCSLLSDCILVGTPLRHMNLLNASKKLSVEYESMNAPWIADVPVHSRMTPYPYKVCLLLTVPRNSIGPNRSAATDWNSGAGAGSMVWQWVLCPMDPLLFHLYSVHFCLLLVCLQLPRLLGAICEEPPCNLYD